MEKIELNALQCKALGNCAEVIKCRLTIMASVLFWDAPLRVMEALRVRSLLRPTTLVIEMDEIGYYLTHDVAFDTLTSVRESF